MIVGSVNARLEAVLLLQIEDSSGHMHIFEIIIDTGFTGELTLRSADVTALGLPWIGTRIVQLANGSQQTIDVHDAILWWDYNPIQVKVQVVETAPLLGTRLLAGHELKVHFVPGGAVTVTPIP